MLRIGNKKSVFFSNFIKYTFSANFLDSFQYTITTNSMLKSLNKNSTENLITMNFLCKDIVGQTSSVIFSDKVGKNVDSDIKKSGKRLVILKQCSAATELMTEIIPFKYFIPMTCLSNAGKNISYAGFCSINAKIIQKNISKDNIGEAYSKFCASNSISSSLGMLSGMAVIYFIPSFKLRLAIVVCVAPFRYYIMKKLTELF